MKALLTLALLLVFSPFCFSQDMPKVDFATLNLEKSSKVDIISAYKVENGYIIIKKEPIRGPGGWNYFIELFDTDLRSIKLHDITEQFEKEDFIIQNIFKVADSYLLFSTKNYREEQKEELYGQYINGETGALSKLKMIYQEAYEGRYSAIEYVIKPSSDEQSALLTIYPRTKMNESKKIHFHVYDEHLEELWSQENVTFEPYKEEQIYSVKQTALSDNGAIFALGMITEKKQDAIYEVRVLGSDDEHVTRLDPGDRTFDDVRLIISEDNTVYVGGYYRKKDGVGIDGVFLYTLDAVTGEIVSEAWDEFSRDLISKFMSARAMAKAEKKSDRKGTDLGLNNLELRSVIKHDDGTISLVGELFWITTHTTTNANGMTTTTTTYHYGDLMISDLDNQGEFVGHSHFNKHHTYWGAYTYFSYNNNVTILMVGSRSLLYDGNFAALPRKERAPYAGIALFMHEINGDEKYPISEIINYTKDEYKGYQPFNHIGSNCSILETPESLEMLILTNMGKKQFGLCRIALL